ncbi:MAG: universal stress protein [Actinomycetota bacterium]|nr:universal stress protein [Actinomycetota bacterium]
MRKIIVGVDESQGSSDAIALASSLADITGSELMLVNVFPYDERPSRALNRGFEEYLRQISRDLLGRLRSTLGDENVEVRSIANPSPAHGLHELAEQENAALIVVGSTHTGRAGRVLPGSTAERLLHGSPCPVAVAPKGHTQERVPTIIGCGYDGSAAARHALEAAHSVAAATGARLRAIRAFQPLAFEVPPDVAPGGSYNDALHDRAAADLDAAVATIETEPRAEKFFAVGDAADILAEASEQLDLLFVGSRGYGPLHAVMVGGVSGRLVREAACPVIVLPRTAGHTEEDSLFTRATALQASNSV